MWDIGFLSSVFEYPMMKTWKTDLSEAINKSRLHSVCIQWCYSQPLWTLEMVMCLIVWIKQNYSWFYFILIIWNHDCSSSYCTWKVFSIPVYIFPVCVLFFSSCVYLSFSLFTLTPLLVSQTCISLTILTKTTWHLTNHPFV